MGWGIAEGGVVQGGIGCSRGWGGAGWDWV